MMAEEAGAPNDPGSRAVRSMAALNWSTRKSPAWFTDGFSEATLPRDASTEIIDQMYLI